MMKFYDTLTEALQRPPLYKRSSAPFWEDEHISAQMLKAHLDPESDGASRNADFIDRSAQWIDSLFYVFFAARERNFWIWAAGPGCMRNAFSDADTALRAWIFPGDP